MKHFFLLLFLSLFLSACDKEDAFLVDSFRNCEQPKRDAAALTKELLGSWELKEKACGLCSKEFSREVKEEVLLTFKTDNSYVVKDAAQQVLETGQWDIADTDAGANITISITEGSSQYLPGILGICNNQLFADQTYIDLLGFLYVKVD